VEETRNASRILAGKSKGRGRLSEIGVKGNDKIKEV
jgi:hypothetical protein